MKKNLNSGFTLIELLVVIAIIGILASVVLASLNSARSKGADAAVKANLANARAQAEMYYDTAGNYDSVCTAAGGIGNAVLAAAKAFSNSLTVTTGTSTATTAVCNATTGANGGWAAAVPLKNTADGAVYCVDSSGSAKAAAVGTIGAADVTC